MKKIVVLIAVFTAVLSMVNVCFGADSAGCQLRAKYLADLRKLDQVGENMDWITHPQVSSEIYALADRYTALEKRVVAELKKSLSAKDAKALDANQNAWHAQLNKDITAEVRCWGDGNGAGDVKGGNTIDYTHVRVSFLISKLGKPNATRAAFASQALDLEKKGLSFGNRTWLYSDNYDRTKHNAALAYKWADLHAKINKYLAGTAKASEVAKHKTAFNENFNRKVAIEKRDREDESESDIRNELIVDKYSDDCWYLISLID